MTPFQISPGLWLAGLTLGFSVLASAPPAFSAENEGRAVLNLGYDDNVTETPSDLEKGDFLYRMILEGRTRFSPRPGLVFSGTFWNGGEFFFREEEENRLRQNLALRVALLNRFFTGEMKGTLENSFYPWKENYYYLKPGTQLDLRRPLSSIFTVGFIGDYRFFNYHPEDNLNYHLLSFAGLLQAQIIESLGAQLSGGQIRHWYGAPALILDPNGNLVPGPGDRADTISEVSSSLSFSRKFLLKPTYSFQKGSSNSFGLSYTSHRVSLTFSYPFPTQTLVHLLAVIQVKKYGDLGKYTIWAEDRRILLADEEDENLNSISLRIEQILTEHFSLQLTYNRYSNEFSGSRPYSKNLFLLGARLGL